MNRIFIAIAVTLCFLLTGCSAVRLASAAGKAAKASSAASKATKATVAATKAGTATKVVGQGAAVAVVAHADDAVGLARIADSAENFRFVISDAPKASGKSGLSSFSSKELEHIATGLDLADLLNSTSTWELGEDYELGEGGPPSMKEALGDYPSTIAISPALPVGDSRWVQWIRRLEGERLCLYEPAKNKLAFLELVHRPQEH